MSVAIFSAEWRPLVVLSFAVDPELLRPKLPAGVELDLWRGATFVSLVGFRSVGTRVLGLPIPFHTAFEQVNLRFYVRRREGDRAGVVFLKELVPRRAIALGARLLYGEHYQAVRMEHELGARASFAFETPEGWARLGATPLGEPALPAPGSLEEFLIERHWGYTARPHGTLEYEVQHPPWRIQTVREPFVAGELAAVFGRDLAAVLRVEPANAFVAEGSRARALWRHRLEEPKLTRDARPIRS